MDSNTELTLREKINILESSSETNRNIEKLGTVEAVGGLAMVGVGLYQAIRTGETTPLTTALIATGILETGIGATLNRTFGRLSDSQTKVTEELKLEQLTLETKEAERRRRYEINQKI